MHRDTLIHYLRFRSAYVLFEIRKSKSSAGSSGISLSARIFFVISLFFIILFFHVIWKYSTVILRYLKNFTCMVHVGLTLGSVNYLILTAQALPVQLFAGFWVENRK